MPKNTSNKKSVKYNLKPHFNVKLEEVKVKKYIDPVLNRIILMLKN